MRRIFYYFLLSFLFLPYTFAESALTAIDGQVIPLSTLKGKWVMINYWASWCPSCIHEIGALNRFYAKNKADIALYAVNYDELSVDEQKGLIQKYKINYPSLAEDPATVLHLGNIIGIPATFIFDPRGTLVKTLYGEQSYAHLTDVYARIAG